MAAEAKTGKKAKKVFTAFKSLCERKGATVTKFIDKSGETLSPEDVRELKEHTKSLKEQLTRMDTEWESYIHILEDSEHDTISEMVNSVQDNVESILELSEQTIKDKGTKESAPVPAAQETPSEKRWKPRVEFIPTKLSLTDGPIELETFKSRLESYLQGHEGQTHNDLYNLLDDLIEGNIKSSVGFNRKDKMAIFGPGSLMEKIENLWEEEYPVNKLRMTQLEKTSGPNETWDAWQTRFTADFVKADFESLSVQDVGNLMMIMNYQGPHATKIKQEFAKSTQSGDKNKIDIALAKKVFHQEIFSSKLCENNSVKQLHSQKGKYNNNKGQYQNNFPKGQAVYNKNQTRPGEKQHSFKYEDDPVYKKMVAQKRCFRCASEKCPNSNNQSKCPNIAKISCNYCKKLQKKEKGHVEASCMRKGRDQRNASTNFDGVKQIFNPVREEDDTDI